MKRLLFAALLAAPLNPVVAQDDGLSSLGCAQFASTFFVGVTNVECRGFYFKNQNNGAVTDDAKSAVRSLLGQPSLAVSNIEQIKLTDGGQFIDFSRFLNGTTVIGIHWGSGVFKKFSQTDPILDADDLSVPKNLGTAFFKFDAGTNLDKLEVSRFWRTSLSNAALYSTGACTSNCGGGGNNIPVPEPASWALVSAGLVGLGAIARRRRKSAQ